MKKRYLLGMAAMLCMTAATTMTAMANTDALTSVRTGVFDTNLTDADGGITEIVKYNSDNHCFYVVNGKLGVLQVVSTKEAQETDGLTNMQLVKAIDLKEAAEAMDPSFRYGDMTSVDVSTANKMVAVALQAEGYNDNGRIALLDYEGNLLRLLEAGKQPDMIIFTADGSKLLTANEGEPRKGYTEADPEGSVTVVSMSADPAACQAVTVGFDAFDARRQELVDGNVIIKKGSSPSTDFEPEYIATAPDGKSAYVALQEANAIAKLNLETLNFEYVKSLGFKNHGKGVNQLDLMSDGQIDICYQDVYGVYMPDGIAAWEADGKVYLATANEGDGREWGDEDAGTYYCNELKRKDIGSGEKVTTLDSSDYDGLDLEKTYIFGARSFSIFDADTMELVYDSGSGIEKNVAIRLPEFFNVSNDDLEMDGRSGKKGPEPEDVKIGTVGDQTYAFIALERVGGIMIYNVTKPSESSFAGYINDRDYSAEIKGDVAPEGLCFIPAEQSIDGTAKLLAANEVSGTVSLYDLQ